MASAIIKLPDRIIVGLVINILAFHWCFEKHFNG